MFEELQPDRAEFLEDEAQLTEKRLKTSDLEVKIAVGDDYEGLFSEYNKIRINYIHSKLFDPNYDQNKPKKVLDQIKYRSDLTLEAREILKSTKYCGLEIIIDENVNWEVLAILQEKFNSGEEWTKLEMIISDVAVFYMGGQPSKEHGTVDLDEEPSHYTRVISNKPYNSDLESYIKNVVLQSDFEEYIPNQLEDITLEEEQFTSISEEGKEFDEYQRQMDSYIRLLEDSAKGLVYLNEREIPRRRTQTHELRDWKDHPTYRLYSIMLRLLNDYRWRYTDGRTPSRLPQTQLLQLLGENSRDNNIFNRPFRSLRQGYHSWFSYERLYKWLFALNANPRVSKEDVNIMLHLIEEYRMNPESGLSHPDNDADALVWNLKFAFRKTDYQGRVYLPNNNELTRILNMETEGHATPFDFARGTEWGKDRVRRLLYGLYKTAGVYNRRPASFLLDNLGTLSMDEYYDYIIFSSRVDHSVKRAFIAVNEYSVKKKYDSIFEPNPVQELIMVMRWFLSDYRGHYVINKELADFLDIPESSFWNYVDGIRSFVEDFGKFEDAIRKINGYVDRHSQKYLEFLREAADKYIASRSLIGTITDCAHRGYEDITNRRMNRLGIPSIQEKRLPNGRVPDNIIHRTQDGESEDNSVFIEAIENRQSIITKEKLVGHSWIVVDYTISPDETWIKEKCVQRGYATSDRFLIIVLYGDHSTAKTQEAKDLANSYGNVQLLTESEYKEFLGLNQDRELLAIYNRISQGSIDGFDPELSKSDAAVQTLRDIRVPALLNLKIHKDKWLDYFKQYF